MNKFLSFNKVFKLQKILYILVYIFLKEIFLRLIEFILYSISNNFSVQFTGILLGNL